MSFHLLVLIVITLLPITVSSQESAKGKYIMDELKGNTRKSLRYYLRKEVLESPGFSTRYVSLFSGSGNYTKEDTLLSAQLISRLYAVDSIFFFKMMRIRLEWLFKERLTLSDFSSSKDLIKTKADQAHYDYMTGLYYWDLYMEKFARHMGYVRALSDDSEIVDWKKMNEIRWGRIKVIEQISHGPTPVFKNENLKDSAFAYFKKAIDGSGSEFFYYKQLLFYLSKHNEKTQLQQLITSSLSRYSDRERKWLRKVVKKYFIHLNNHRP